MTGNADAVNTVLQVVRTDIPEALGSGAYEQHLLPYVPEILPVVNQAQQQVFARPPNGLLELGRRDMRLRQLKQELQVQGFPTAVLQRAGPVRSVSLHFSLVCLLGSKLWQCPPCKNPSHLLVQDFAAATKAELSRMPTKQGLSAAGRQDLVRAVERDGGFLEVSQLLGLTARRRPNGYWDNLEALDQVSAYLQHNIPGLPQPSA